MWSPAAPTLPHDTTESLRRAGRGTGTPGQNQWHAVGNSPRCVPSGRHDPMARSAAEAPTRNGCRSSAAWTAGGRRLARRRSGEPAGARDMARRALQPAARPIGLIKNAAGYRLQQLLQRSIPWPYNGRDQLRRWHGSQASRTNTSEPGRSRRRLGGLVRCGPIRIECVSGDRLFAEIGRDLRDYCEKVISTGGKV